jgi:hypothetical protein
MHESLEQRLRHLNDLSPLRFRPHAFAHLLDFVILKQIQDLSTRQQTVSILHERLGANLDVLQEENRPLLFNARLQHYLLHIIMKFVSTVVLRHLNHVKLTHEHVRG